MTVQLAMFRPPWWTPADDAVCADHEREEARDDFPRAADPETPGGAARLEAWCESLHPRAAEYRCRNCLYWESADGARGECHGPESACGTTRATSGCEQWSPRLYELATYPAPWPEPEPNGLPF